MRIPVGSARLVSWLLLGCALASCGNPAGDADGGGGAGGEAGAAGGTGGGGAGGAGGCGAGGAGGCGLGGDGGTGGPSCPDYPRGPTLVSAQLEGPPRDFRGEFDPLVVELEAILEDAGDGPPPYERWEAPPGGWDRLVAFGNRDADRWARVVDGLSGVAYLLRWRAAGVAPLQAGDSVAVSAYAPGWSFDAGATSLRVDGPAGLVLWTVDGGPVRDAPGGVRFETGASLCAPIEEQESGCYVEWFEHLVSWPGQPPIPVVEPVFEAQGYRFEVTPFVLERSDAGACHSNGLDAAMHVLPILPP